MAKIFFQCDFQSVEVRAPFRTLLQEIGWIEAFVRNPQSKVRQSAGGLSADRVRGSGQTRLVDGV